MTGLVFVDTNVLIYARDRKNAEKRTLAQQWLYTLAETQRGRMNLQVLNEFTRWVLVNEAQRSVDEVRSEIEALRGWGAKPLDEEQVGLAWSVRKQFGYQWFDCLLVAAAHVMGCSFFLTEDMGEGTTFGSVKLVNPFRSAPSDVLSAH